MSLNPPLFFISSLICCKAFLAEVNLWASVDIGGAFSLKGAGLGYFGFKVVSTCAGGAGGGAGAGPSAALSLGSIGVSLAARIRSILSAFALSKARESSITRAEESKASSMLSKIASSNASLYLVPPVNSKDCGSVGAIFARGAKGLFLSINVVALSNALCLNDGLGVFNSILVNELDLGTLGSAA